MKILEDTKNLLHKISAKQLLHDPIPDHIRCFPAVSKLSKYPPSLGGYINFEIFIAQGDVPDHLLYEAKRQDVNEHILIKFVKVYSIELHNFCAQKGHAPKILGYEWLPGGWYICKLGRCSTALRRGGMPWNVWNTSPVPECTGMPVPDNLAHIWPSKDGCHV